jgi:hypothetical protein
MLEGAAVTAPVTYRWVHAFGDKNITSSIGSGSQRNTYVVAPSQLTFGAPPIIAWSVLSKNGSEDTRLFFGVLSDATGYTSVWSSLDARAIDVYLYWNSIGTVDY